MSSDGSEGDVRICSCEFSLECHVHDGGIWGGKLVAG